MKNIEIQSAEDNGVIVCRCEGLTWKTVQDAINTLHPTSLRQLKLVTRWGMGICQGRVCRPLMAATGLSESDDPALALRVRLPLKPMNMGVFGHGGGTVDE